MVEQSGHRPFHALSIPYPIVVAAVAATLLIAAATVAPVPVTYALAVLIAAALVVGPAVVLGGGAGVLVHDLLRGAVGYWTATDAVWLFVFAGFLVWLAPAPVVRRGGRSPPVRRTVGRYALAVGVAGTLGTAAAAWLALMIGGQRFYTGAAGLLGGFLVTAVCVSVLIAVDRSGEERDEHTAAGGPPAESPATGPAGWRLVRAWRCPSTRTAVYFLLIGLAWLAGGMVLDTLAHDLATLPNEQALRAYAAGVVGTGSPLSVAATSVLVGIHRYGEWAVRLSAPVAAVAVWMAHRRTGTRPRGDR